MEEKEEVKKLSYEELEKVAGQVSQQLEQAKAIIQQQRKQMDMMNMQQVAVRLEFLFKILDKEDFFAPDTIEKASEEIVSIMYPQPEEETKTEE
jgi:hypothetical protein